MVAKLNPPTLNSTDLIYQIIDERGHHKDFYNRIKSDWTSATDTYNQNCGDPKLIQPLILRRYTDTDEDASKRKVSLIGLYSPKKDKLPYSILENMRKNHGLIFCPSCGESGRPRTLDHYLPKNVFPEYSVVLLNLTPMCDWCQGEKLTDYITADGLKCYIHPYFDDVDKPLFSITFNPPYVTPTIGLLINSDIDPELKRLVISHLAGIDFLERYKDYFRTKYRSILRKAGRCRAPNSTNLRNYLEENLESELDNSKNSWEVVLYRSILADARIMNYLEVGELPEYL